MTVTVKTPPSIEPVTRDECKIWARIDGTELDTEIDGLIIAARTSIESILNRSLITQTLIAYYDEFRTDGRYGRINLDAGPVQSITSVKYLDAGGTEQLLPGTDYNADIISMFPSIYPKPGTSFPATYPGPNAVYIEYVAGYGDVGADVPEALKLGIRMLVAIWLDDPSTPFPESVLGIISGYSGKRVL